MAYDFDYTVGLIGRWIEGNRVTYDDKGKPTDHLEALLDPKQRPLFQKGTKSSQYASVTAADGLGDGGVYTLAQWQADNAAKAALDQQQ